MSETKQNGPEFVPAKRGVVLALGCLAMAVILAFVFVLRHDLRDAKPLDAEAYVVEVPEGFAYVCDVGESGGAYTFRGWACVDGERITSVDCFVVLYNAMNESYLRVPTAMERNDDAWEALGHENYAYGGFTAFVVQKQLDAPAAQYEICFAYRSNEHNELAHTGQMLAEG